MQDCNVGGVSIGRTARMTTWQSSVPGRRGLLGHMRRSMLELHNCRHKTAHTDTHTHSSKKGSPYSITERRVPELIPVPGSQPAGGVSHKPGGSLPFLSARPAVTPTTLKRTATDFAAW